MPDHLIDTPDSPPAGPVIPRGYATKLGELTAAIALIAASAAAIFDIDVDVAELVPIIGAFVTIITVIAGRMAQAAAAEQAARGQAIPDTLEAGDPDDDEDLIPEQPTGHPEPEVDACQADPDAHPKA